MVKETIERHFVKFLRVDGDNANSPVKFGETSSIHERIKE